MMVLGYGMKRGFSLVELLVVIAIIAVLAALVFPALSRAKAKAQGIACLNNLKQLTLAWDMYAHDNNDVLVPNNPPNYWPYGKLGPTWAWGDMRYGNADGTNIDYIIGQREGSLGAVCEDAPAFQMPVRQINDEAGRWSLLSKSAQLLHEWRDGHGSMVRGWHCGISAEVGVFKDNAVAVVRLCGCARGLS